MGLFHKSENQQAFLKAGILGFAGAGKTFTATKLTTGLIGHMKAKELKIADRPAFFLDTETGSDWVQPEFQAAGIELHVAKTRAFADLLTAVKEAEKESSALLIDSISHFWREICDSYMKKRNRTRLQFEDWNYLKNEWGKFTDLFVNSNLHIVMCGRAGYEYDYFEDDSGKKQLEKTGIKMRAETETGYEPSLLFLMERHMDMETKTVWREAHVLKDRARLLDGKTFKNPSFKDFLPHVEFLNLGGQQLGVDTSRTSEDMISNEGSNGWAKEKERREILIEKIGAVFALNGLSGRTQEGNKKIILLLEKHFNTTAWKELETIKADRLQIGLIALEGEFTPEPALAEQA